MILGGTSHRLHPGQGPPCPPWGGSAPWPTSSTLGTPAQKSTKETPRPGELLSAPVHPGLWPLQAWQAGLRMHSLSLQLHRNTGLHCSCCQALLTASLDSSFASFAFRLSWPDMRVLSSAAATPLCVCSCSHHPSAIPCYFNYYSFVIEFESRKHHASSFVLSQDCFGYSGPSVVPYKF